VNNRLGGGYQGDTETPEQFIPATGYPGRDWETCMTLNDTWGFKSYDTNWKSTETLIRNLADIASKGGNYLLNVGPTAEGQIPEASVERLAEVGRWMDANGESIYGTSASPFKKLSWGRCTQKPGKLYLHVFDWPKGELVVPGLKNRVTKAYLLTDASKKPLAVTVSEDGPKVKLPSQAPDKIDSVVVLEIVGKLDVEPQVLGQNDAGAVELLAPEATLHGKTFKCQGSGAGENIGYWIDKNDWVSWDFKVTKPGKFDVQITLACEAANAGSKFDVALGEQMNVAVKAVLPRKRSTVSVKLPEQKLSGKVESTGGWEKFVDVKVGTLTIAQPGRCTLSIKPTEMPRGAVMNLKSVVLKPAKP
jgi:alpha-L-fucosidase